MQAKHENFETKYVSIKFPFVRLAKSQNIDVPFPAVSTLFHLLRRALRNKWRKNNAFQGIWGPTVSCPFDSGEEQNCADFSSVAADFPQLR